MTEPNQEPITRALTVPTVGVPVLDDPEVRAALEIIARTTLEEIATAYRPVITRALSLAAEAECIPVTSAAECEFMQEWLATEVATTEERAAKIVDPYAGFAHRLHRAFTGLRALVTDETKRAREIANPKIVEWGRAVERMRQDAERRAREEREAAELRLVISRMPYLGHVGIAQVAEITAVEREKQAAVDRAREAGDHEVADAMADQIGKVETPTIQPELALSLPSVAPPAAAVPEKPKGIAKNWRARLSSKTRLIRFIATHPEYENLLDLDQGVADKLAKALEDKLAQTIPGLEGYDDPTVRKTPRRGR